MDNPFDRACRYLIRQGEGSLLHWLLGVPADACRLVRWLDCRLNVPGQPERESDTLAHVHRTDQGGIPWAILIEFQTEPDPLMFGRLLVYQGLIWLQEKPIDLPGDRFQLQSVVVNLTGRGMSGRRMTWRDGAGTVVEPIEWNLATLDAGVVLDQVLTGQTPRAVLPWIPLMQRGAEEAIMHCWLQVAEQEADPRRKADLALVRVFAELATCEDAWHRVLEGFNVRESRVVNEWKAEGRNEARAEALREVLEARFGELPADLGSRLSESHTTDVLRRWNILAARAASLEQFRQDAGL